MSFEPGLASLGSVFLLTAHGLPLMAPSSVLSRQMKATAAVRGRNEPRGERREAMRRVPDHRREPPAANRRSCATIHGERSPKRSPLSASAPQREARRPQRLTQSESAIASSSPTPDRADDHLPRTGGSMAPEGDGFCHSMLKRLFSLALSGDGRGGCPWVPSAARR
jgi:hypothetical protein